MKHAGGVRTVDADWSASVSLAFGGICKLSRASETLALQSETVSFAGD